MGVLLPKQCWKGCKYQIMSRDNRNWYKQKYWIWTKKCAYTNIGCFLLLFFFCLFFFTFKCYGSNSNGTLSPLLLHQNTKLCLESSRENQTLNKLKSSSKLLFRSLQRKEKSSFAKNKFMESHEKHLAHNQRVKLMWIKHWKHTCKHVERHLLP